MIPILAFASGFSLTLTPVVLGVIFLLVFAVWLTFTFIVRYHWNNYGTGATEIFRMNFLYLTGSGTLITLLIVSLIGYSLTSL
jgi:hypothetical protein